MPGNVGTSAKRCGIAVMAKASKPGRTKTRLTPPLTPEQASRLNTAFLHDVAANLLEAGELGSIAGYMAFGPPADADFFRCFPPGIGLFEAWCPTFGETLAGAIARLLDLGHRAACVLNADSPTLPVAILVEAAARLSTEGDRLVLGPSNDGGYYLLGMNKLHMHLFRDIAWSTEVVASQTLQRAADIGLPVDMLPEWYDVDDAAALATLRRELLEGVPFGSAASPSGPARRTKAMLSLFQDEGRRDGSSGSLV